MNILLGILKYPPEFAGDGMRLHRTFQSLRQRGSVQDVYVMTSWENSSPEMSMHDGICIYRPVESTLKKRVLFDKIRQICFLPFGILKTILIYWNLYKKIDIVMTAGSGWFPSLIAWFAFLTRKPVVKEIVLLGSDDPVSIQNHKPFWVRWFFTAPFHFAKLIIAISPALKTACLKYGISNNKIWCRFNAVDFDFDNFQAPVIHKDEPPVILWVGSISPRKNVEFLLRSACYLRVPAQVWFVGPCYDAGYMKKLAAIQNELPPHVSARFWGHIKDRKELQTLYRRAHLFWFASEKEGMGNVVAEAMTCGTPVLALPVMGIMQQVIPTPDDGEVIETNRPEEFALAACRWLYKEVDHAAIAERAQARFDVKSVEDGYISRLQRIAQNVSVHKQNKISVLALEETAK